MDTVPNNRRLFLQALAASPLALAMGPAWAAPRPVTVVTSYPDAVIARFEAAFEAAYPEYRLNVIWRMPHDALPYLRQPGQNNVDVYWSASPRNFNSLKAEGAWQPLGIPLDGLPAVLGKTPIGDPEGYFTATELAGYGFAVNPARLAALQVAPPADWPALADPRLAGAIALPIPARVGFAPVMVDIVLQAYGWERGWALWSEIAGLSRLVDRGATFVGDEVAQGRCAVGLSIDFFVASAIANGAPIDFRYPGHGGINPGQIAITRSAPNPEGARAFARFILSRPTQALLCHPDIRKLPARPEAYVLAPAGYHDPFAAAAGGAYDYDGERGRGRLALIAHLFEACLIQPHAEVTELWARLHKLEARSGRRDDLRRRLGAVPCSEAEADRGELRALFKDRVEGDDFQSLPQVQAWREQAARARRGVAAELQEAGV
jgi:phosphoglycerate transport regulatory protein PgtC